MIVYAYFGNLISDLFLTANNNNNNEQNLSNQFNSNQINQMNQTIDSGHSKGKNMKFIKTITSTELIIILWFTIIYGSCLLLFLRFKVLKLERDPNSEKHKKSDSTEDFNAFINKNRNSKQSFKNKNLNQVMTINDNSNDRNIPFWQK